MHEWSTICVKMGKLYVWCWFDLTAFPVGHDDDEFASLAIVHAWCCWQTMQEVKGKTHTWRQMLNHCTDMGLSYLSLLLSSGTHHEWLFPAYIQAAKSPPQPQPTPMGQPCLLILCPQYLIFYSPLSLQGQGRLDFLAWFNYVWFG